MDKYELINITIQKLIDHFSGSPESFEFSDNIIIYQPRLQMEADSAIIKDPNNNHAVVVHFNDHINELKCYLFLKVPIGLSFPTPNLSGADSVITSSRWFEKQRGNYKKFCKLKELIKQRDRRKENMSYLRKLSSLFPDALDSHLLK